MGIISKGPPPYSRTLGTESYLANIFVIPLRKCSFRLTETYADARSVYDRQLSYIVHMQELVRRKPVPA